MRPWRNRRIIVILLIIIWPITFFFLLAVVWKKGLSANSSGSNYLELVWWTGIPHNYDKVRQCGYHSCRVTSKRERLPFARSILFYGSDLKVHDFPMPRTEKHLWALLHEESPRNVPYAMNPAFLKHFNCTSTFSRYSDLPLTTQYLHSARDLTSLENFQKLQFKENSAFNSNLAPVIFLQTDCDTMSGREDYVRELMKYIMVDCYGGCLNNRDLPKILKKDYLDNLYSPDLIRFVARYKFMIAIENGVCDDYITEKFWRPLIAGVVPIYFGSPTIKDWQPRNKSAIYVNDFPNAEALAKYLLHLHENDDAYNAYLGHKLERQNRIQNNMLMEELLTRSYDGVGNIFQKFECFVCQYADKVSTIAPRQRDIQKLYNCPYPPAHVPLQHNKEPKYAADWRSIAAVGRCQAELLNRFWQENRPYSKTEFDVRLAEMVAQNLCSYNNKMP